MEQFEALENLFDICDERQSGKVSVSTLIMAMRNEVFKSDKEANIAERHALLQSVRDLLDPLQQDTLIDKATWTNAWQRLGSNDLDASSDDLGPLDQSKQSFCFSPGSRSSSLDSEADDSSILKQENECLRNNLKLLKEQLQTQEDALIQEQMERKELETNYASSKNQITKLTKQVKQLQETTEDLQSTIDQCERVKNNTVDQLHATENQLRAQLAARNNEICLLNKEIEDLNQTVHVLKCEIDELKIELSQEKKNHRAQIEEYQEAMQADRHEMSAKITHSLFYKRDLAARLEECDFSGIDLQAELLELSDTMSSLSVDMKGDTSLSPKFQSAALSTPRLLHVKPAVTSSLLEEMKALGSGITSSSILDCSFDITASSLQGASELDDSWSSGEDEKDLKSLPVISSVKILNESESRPLQQQKIAFQSNNNASLVQNPADLDNVKNAEEIYTCQEDDPIKASCETNKNHISDKHVNTIHLNLLKCADIQSCSVGTQTMFEMGRQSHLSVSEVGIQATRTSHLTVSDVETYHYVEKLSINAPVCEIGTQTMFETGRQSHLSVSEVGIQATRTSHLTVNDGETHHYVEKLSIHAPVCEIGTQTVQEKFMQDENSCLKMLEERLLEPPSTDIYQTNFGMNIDCEKCSCGKGMSKGLTSFNLSNNTLEQSSYERKEIGTQTMDKTPPMHQSKFFFPLLDSVAKSTLKNQLEEPSSTYTWTQQDALSLDKWKNTDLANDLVHSTVVEKHKLTSSEMDLPKKRFKFWLAIICFVCLNVMVLMCSTVILTAGVLETMSQSGFLSGAPPRWMPELSFLVKPFLRIDYRTREPIV